jgi:tRNA pseudouridine55 synthase
MTGLHGFLCIDKPLGITSHDAVNIARRALHEKKIGHAGTLDPLASGVLVLCVGAAARLSEYVMASSKRYHASVHLGRETTTYDGEGEIVSEVDPSAVRESDIRAALVPFIGEIEQRPPAYSAIKQGGQRLYELARAGKTVEVPARRIRIDSITLLDWQPPILQLDIRCGPGTYIRSLAHDIGAVLSIGGSLAALVRTASGQFTLEQAVALETLRSDPHPERWLIPPAQGLADWPTLALGQEAAARVRRGLAVDGPAAAPDRLALGLDETGALIAVLRAVDGRWAPHKVLVV